MPFHSQKAKVSVIIPAYNAEHSLNKCLESVFAQTLVPYEVIVINDGSTDDTAGAAHQYQERIIYLEQPNLGQGAARNAGMDLATGDYIAFLDADDFWLPDFLGSTVNFLLMHDDAVAVSVGLILKQMNGAELIMPKLLRNNSVTHESGMLDDFFDFWAKHDHVRTGSVLISHDIIRQAGQQRADLRISQDLEYWGYLATFGKWGFIPIPLWVGNSVRVAAKSGWASKYQTRRRLCPTVEAWQERIMPRVQPGQLTNFKIVRGRVAANFALSMIKSGRSADAWEIVRNYIEEMPDFWSINILRMGTRMGWIGRLTAQWIIRAREKYKSLLIKVSWLINYQ